MLQDKEKIENRRILDVPKSLNIRTGTTIAVLRAQLLSQSFVNVGVDPVRA